MNKKTAWGNAPAFLAALCVFALAATLCVLAHPATALADDAIAHSTDASGSRTEYTSVADAVNAGYNGATIVMDKEWDLGSGSLDLADSKSITIDMNGFRIISSNKDATIYLNEHTKLKLTSSAPAHTFQYWGYLPSKSYWTHSWVDTAGFVTNYVDGGTSEGSGVHMESDASLTLENVAVGGCGHNGVYAKNDCSVDMSNAQVCRNRADKGSSGYGGGIRLGARCTLNMSNSSRVTQNFAPGVGYGGGIFAEKDAMINLESGSTVERNSALYGGGIYLNGTDFTVKSQDGTGQLYRNSGDGGAIHVDSASGENEGLIEGLSIRDNEARYGGGIWLGQRWTTVRNCTITGNNACFDAGGIIVKNSNNTLDNCTITGNYCCNGYTGYEGGGIFVSYKYDIKLTGKCVIKDNTRGKDTGNADDVFLSTLSGGGGKAYITGGLSEGSTVGVRTGIEGDRRVATKFTPDTKDCLFADMDGYYISYGTDQGGDAWQRHATREFAVKANGQELGRYQYGSAVAVTAPAAQDGKTFWFWSDQGTKGLNPVGTYINDSTRYSSALGFKMQQNDVDLSAVYADIVTSAKIFSFESPVAGEDLPTTAGLTRTDGKRSGANNKIDATVTWYEVGADGNRTVAAGKAKENTAYVAEFSVPQSVKYGCFFNESMGAGDVTVEASQAKVASAKVDASTGTLTVEATGFTTGDAKSGTEVMTGSVTVDCEKRNPLESGGEDTAALTLTNDGTSAPLSDGGSLGKIKFAYAYSSDSDTVTITAPHVANYNFCNWDNPKEDWRYDDSLGIVEIPASELKEISTLTAVYTPIVTEAKLAVSAPEAAGDSLADSLSELKVICSDGSKYDLAEIFGAGSLPVSWSPEGTDGKAGYSTAYTAMVKIEDEASDMEDVDKVIGANAKVEASNNVETTGAGFAIIDGSLYLCVSFPATADAKATSIAQPGDVELTFEEAAGYAAEQAAHADTLCWPLPKTVDVTLQNDETVDGEITWDIPEGFDVNATTAQEIVVKGTVRVASEEQVDTSGISLDVSTTIKIAAPSQGGGEDDGDTPVVNPENEGSDNGSNGNGTTDAKSTSAKTSDAIPVFAVAAVAVVAIAAVVVAIVALRRRKN